MKSKYARALAVGFVGLMLAILALPTQPTRLAADDPKTQTPFPDYGYKPPADQYSGPLFQLSQNYPTAESKAPLPGFYKIKYMDNAGGKDNWKKYLDAVREYCFDGNINNDWVVQKNTKRKWYHAPWLHFGPNGREGIHGLTREATAHPMQLGPMQKDAFQSFAVGFFNEEAGYTVGQTWADHTNPNAKAAKFKHGAVICKLLFTLATPDEVPYLDKDTVWKAYTPLSDTDATRKVQDVRLLQMDVMIRDDNAPNGWVFGTYCYNSKLGQADMWHNLVPVGLMWGNDPTITEDKTNPAPTKTIINPALKESVINPSSDLPPQHLGWNSRLNGPLDYNASSCMSCHSVAQYPAKAALNPDFTKPAVKHGSEAWMVWFQNLPCGKNFSEGCESTDYCLQLSMGITNFHTAKDPKLKHPLFLRNIPLPK